MRLASTRRRRFDASNVDDRVPHRLRSSITRCRAASDFYDSQYDRKSADIQAAIRREVYGDDFGQTSWITGAEAGEWFETLKLGREQRALEVACGAGGLTCALAAHSRASCTGVDINASGIEAARRRAEESGVAENAFFKVVDAGVRLPFEDAHFDAIVSNDSINHIPDRASMFAEWHRVLKTGGVALFTDPVVVTGFITSDDVRRRSSIGYFVFTPAGYNERLMEDAGFEVLDVRDLTEPVARISRRWADAREQRRGDLVATEGQDSFALFQDFLNAVHRLSSERRLSRYRYFARRC